MSYYEVYKMKGADNPRGCNEIEHWTERDRRSNEMLMDIRDQYILKIQKGKFNKQLAIKGLTNYVKTRITDYNKKGFDYRISLTPHDKELVAKHIFEYLWYKYLNKIKIGIPPKKSRRFNNETYQFYKRYDKRSEATKGKEKMIRTSKIAIKHRIFSSKDGHDLYIRRK